MQMKPRKLTHCSYVLHGCMILPVYVILVAPAAVQGTYPQGKHDTNITQSKPILTIKAILRHALSHT